MTETPLYGWGLPIRASTHAGMIDFGINLIHAVMIAIFVLWGLFFLYCLIRYRRRAGQGATYHQGGHVTALLPDVFVLIFELVLIFAYAIPNWAALRQQMPDESQAVVVRVIAEQFIWNIQYPGADGKFGRTDPRLVTQENLIGLDRADPAAADDLHRLNEIHLPVDRPALIYLSSKDVIHSLFVPEFRLKQDAVPGLRIPVWVTPNRVGRYEIGCAQLCGLGHYRMRGDVIVQTQADYDAWFKAQTP